MVVQSLLLFATTLSFAAPAKISLSQKAVAELVLKQGLQTKEVTYKYEQSQLNALQAKSVTDWKALIESGYEQDKAESLTAIGDYKYERYITTASLSKALITGTQVTASIARTSVKNVLNPNATTPPQMNQDILGLNLEQSLWGNSFGVGTRAAINQADYAYQATIGLRTDELENVVLESIRQFWATYVAQESFRQAIGSRERYEKLVAAVRRKSGLGYSNPGEFSQVQAAYELRNQEVKSASTNYLKTLDSFITSLDLPTGTEIDFVVPKDLPPVPKLDEKNLEDLRVIKAQALNVKAADAAVSLAKSNLNPTLNLVGRYNASGVEPTTEASYAELTAGTHPKYYVGLKFQYNFGSGVLTEDVHAKKAAFALEELKLRRTRMEQRDSFAATERYVGATYAIAQSKIIERNMREKAVQEMTRTYNQGRTDINILIEAMNQLFATQVQAIEALGNYHVALNEWAAARDELIPDQQQEESK